MIDRLLDSAAVGIGLLCCGVLVAELLRDFLADSGRAGRRRD